MERGYTEIKNGKFANSQIKKTAIVWKLNNEFDDIVDRINREEKQKNTLNRTWKGLRTKRKTWAEEMRKSRGSSKRAGNLLMYMNMGIVTNLAKLKGGKAELEDAAGLVYINEDRGGHLRFIQLNCRKK